MLIHELLEHTAARLPEKAALICEGCSLTYGEFLRRAEAFASGLEGLGVGQGDRVALLLPNGIEFCIAYFGTLALGAVVVPVNTRLAAEEIAHIINDAAPKALVLGDAFADLYAQTCAGLDAAPVVILTGSPRREGATAFDGLLTNGAAHRRPTLGLDDAACILYTSGTTGKPKGAVMSHGNVFANARNCGAHLHYREADVTLICVPLFHVTGLNSQMVALVYTGGASVLLPKYSTGAVLDAIEEHQITVLFAVPTVYTLLLLREDLDSRSLGSVRLAAYGGAPMPPHTIDQLGRRLGADLYNAYGLTETSSLATVLPCCDATRKAGSVGLPVSGLAARVMAGGGREAAPGEVGELHLKGPNIVARYWNNPEATQAALGGGWLRTGDLAYADPEGFLYVTDRMKDMIMRGGENIYSIEVEAALLSNPEVLEAAVVPRPHSVFGEVVHAFVVPRPGSTCSPEAVVAHCGGRIADYKVPASVSFLDELPRNPGGKVLKNRLRELLPAGDEPR